MDSRKQVTVSSIKIPEQSAAGGGGHARAYGMTMMAVKGMSDGPRLRRRWARSSNGAGYIAAMKMNRTTAVALPVLHRLTVEPSAAYRNRWDVAGDGEEQVGEDVALAQGTHQHRRIMGE